MDNMKALYIISNAGHAESIVEIARSQGARGATILNARGSAPTHQVFMGITIDTEKEIVLCLTTENVCNNIMEAVKEQAGINTAAHGVCFSMPVDKIVGLKTENTPE